MSSGGRSHTAPPAGDRPPVNLPRLVEMKAAGEPIVMVTAYDYPSARVAEEAGVDIVLVGDSAAMVVLGYPGTEPVSMEEMIVLGKAVRRGLKTPLMVGDMPMGSYEASNELAVQNAQRLVKETGCQAVKLEAGGVVGRAGPGDRPLRHPGDGPRRADPADRQRARRLQSPGQDAPRARSSSARTLWRCSRSAASRSSSRRFRRRSPKRSSTSSRSRRSGSAPARQPRARSWSSTTCSASPPAAWRSSSSATPTSTRRWSRRSSRYGAEVRSRHFPEPDHVYSVEPAELDEFRRYLEQESLASAKGWEWEPLP